MALVEDYRSCGHYESDAQRASRYLVVMPEPPRTKDRLGAFWGCPRCGVHTWQYERPEVEELLERAAQFEEECRRICIERGWRELTIRNRRRLMESRPIVHQRPDGPFE